MLIKKKNLYSLHTYTPIILYSIIELRIYGLSGFALATPGTVDTCSAVPDEDIDARCSPFTTNTLTLSLSVSVNNCWVLWASELTPGIAGAKLNMSLMNAPPAYEFDKLRVRLLKTFEEYSTCDADWRCLMERILIQLGLVWCLEMFGCLTSQ